MTSLFIDTSCSRGIVGVVDQNQIKSLVEKVGSKDLSSDIMNMVKEAIDQAELRPPDLDYFYVVNGPGSFTGVRLGVTIGKTMAWALKKNIVPISSLELLATTPFTTDYVIAMIDARRNSSYAGIYDADLNVFLEDQYIANETLWNLLDPMKTYTIVSYDEIAGKEIVAPQVDLLKIISKHDAKEAVSAHALIVNYLKKTEAEEKKSTV